MPEGNGQETQLRIVAEKLRESASAPGSNRGLIRDLACCGHEAAGCKAAA